MPSMEYLKFINPPLIVSLVLFIGAVAFRVWVHANFKGPHMIKLLDGVLFDTTGFILLVMIIFSLPPSLFRSLLEPLIPTLRNLLFSIREFAKHIKGLVIKYRKLSLFYPAAIFGCYALIYSMWENNIFAWIIAAYLLAAVYPLSFSTVISRTFYGSLLTFIGSGVFTLWITGTHQSISPSEVSLMLALSTVLTRASGVVLVYMTTLKLSPLPHENLISVRDSVVKHVETTMNDPKLYPLYPAMAFGSYAIMHSTWSRSEYPWIFAAWLMAFFCPTPYNTTSRFMFYGSEILFAFFAFIISVVQIKLRFPTVSRDLNAWKVYCVFAIIYTISVGSYCIINYRSNRKIDES